MISDDNAYAIYTDGSKSTDSVSTGSACYCPYLNESIAISTVKFASIFTAECIAINEAVKLALTRPNENADIFSDSLSALQALQNSQLSIKINPYILEIKSNINRFLSITKNNSIIKLYWVPAHKGIGGNEIADTLAKAAANNDPNLSMKIPFTDLKEFYKKRSFENTVNLVVEQGKSKGTNYFTYLFKNTAKPWFHNIDLPREIISTINRCRSEHYNLSYSLARVNIVSDSKCKCGLVQDLNHILWQCKIFDCQRSKFTAKLKRLNHQLPLCSNTLLYSPNTAICKAIWTYIKNCNILL